MNETIPRERFMERLLRVFKQAGYPPACILTITPLELSRIPGITVPGIRAVCYMQHMIMSDPQMVDAVVQMLDRYIREVEADG